MTLSRRNLRVLLVVGIVLGIVFTPIAMALLNSVPTSGTIPVESNNGPSVGVSGANQMNLRTPFPDANTVEIKTANSGNVTFSSSAPTSADIAASNITGTWTNVTAIDTSQADLTINPEDKQAITVGKDIDSVAWQAGGAIALDDGNPDFVYAGTTGSSKVVIGGVPSNTQIGAVDQNGVLVDIATSNGNGVVTFDNLDNSKHIITLQTGDAPTVSNLSPQGDQSTEPSTLSADISDPDFSSGDSVTVNFTLDGTQIDSQTVTQNGTVSTQIPQSGQTGGEHSYTIDATDSYGNSDTESATYRVPDTMFIRNETNYSEIIKDPINSTVRFFGDEQIFTRNTSDGTINMTGLPVNEDFIVTIEPSDSNYTKRTVYIKSIYQQQDVFLLNKSAYSTIESRFVLNDPTGQYDSSSVVYIRKPITVNGTTNWYTIHSDRFGVEGVTAVLEEGERYRIAVENERGTYQVVGPYRGDVSEEVTVVPGTPNIVFDSFEQGWDTAASLDNVTLAYGYSDPEKKTDKLKVWIHERGNKSNKLQANETYYDLGNFSRTTTVSTNESEKVWAVNFIIDRGDKKYTVTTYVQNTPHLIPDLSREWRLISGIGMLLLLGGAFSVLNAEIGAVITALSGGMLWWIGWLGGATSAAAVTLAIFIGIVAHLYSSSGP